MTGIDLDELASLPVTVGPSADDRFVALYDFERDALVAAARENTALREALADLLDACDSADPAGGYSDIPEAADRARAVLAGFGR